MDPPATPSADTRESSDISDGNADSSVWPAALPTRGALNFLEQGLTTGVPKPSYDGPIRRRARPDGRRFVDQTFTLPLDAPLNIVESIPEIDILRDYMKSTPEPDLGTASPTDPTTRPAKTVRAAAASAPRDPNTLAKTTGAMSSPRGIVCRPKPPGILRKETPSRASTDSQAPGDGPVSEQRQDNPGGARRAVKFVPPQDDAESAPPEVVEAKPKRMVKIKSRAAVLQWREHLQNLKQQPVETESRAEESAFSDFGRPDR